MMNVLNVYNYYSTVLTPRSNTKLDTHKNSDLKKIYQNIIKQNQTSPLYKFHLSETTQAYAIGIKESAIELEQASAFLGNDSENPFHKTKAISSNEKVVFASMSDNDYSDGSNTLNVRIEKLASPQVNTGLSLPSEKSDLPAGNYSFSINVGQNYYTFDMNVHEGDSNISIQRRLARSINENNIGIRASVQNNAEENNSALILRSNAVGIPDNESGLHFSLNSEFLENDISGVLGVSQTTSMPENARFYINEEPYHSVSNRISINNNIDLDLLSTSNADVWISLKPDTYEAIDKIDSFINAYNQLLDLANETNNNTRGANLLIRDISKITQSHKGELEASGFVIDADGYLSKNESLFSQISQNNQVRDLFNDISEFRQSIQAATQKLTLNPLEYVDKVIITYPNTKANLPNPYEPSKYSGLLFNGYA